VTSADDLASDESAFTGETEPVNKPEKDRLLKGAFITAGKGKMIAAAVGDSAQMGVIAASLGIDHATQTSGAELSPCLHISNQVLMAILISAKLLSAACRYEVTGSTSRLPTISSITCLRGGRCCRSPKGCRRALNSLVAMRKMTRPTALSAGSSHATIDPPRPSARQDGHLTKTR
jgi:hypothetical protein